MEKYKLTPEHEAQMPAWRDHWIANAMSTKSIFDTETFAWRPDGAKLDDREAMRAAIKGLYEAADLKPPPPERIVFVSSPFVLAFASGFAAGIWHSAKNSPKDMTGEPPSFKHGFIDDLKGWSPCVAGIAEAVTAATSGAGWFKRVKAVEPLKQTQKVEDLSEWYRVPLDEILALIAGTGQSKYLRECASQAYGMWDGGNQWSGYPAWLSFFDRVVQLKTVDYSKWRHYEAAAIHGGPRAMHAEFCMVSDRPAVLTVDNRNRPHAATGPFCAWRDGTSLYSYRGVRLPAHIIEMPAEITPAKIDAENNAEIRRVMLELYGEGKYLIETGAEVVHQDEYGVLYRKGDVLAVRVENSTREPDGSRKVYWLPVHPELRPIAPDGTLGEPQELTARNAVASTFNLRGEEYENRIET